MPGVNDPVDFLCDPFPASRHNIVISFKRTLKQSLTVYRWISSLASWQQNDARRLFYWQRLVNSLAPGRFKVNFRWVIFKLILVVNGWTCPHMSVTYDKSTLVQVMAWCRQATSHYLSQCWPRSLSPYGVTRPQWVKPALNRELRLAELSCYPGYWHSMELTDISRVTFIALD